MTFIDRYLRYVGVNMAPPAFHRWAALTILAAAVADRVWVESQGSRLVPNLYTFLIGPSGIGKGVATDLAMRVISESGVIRVYSGMLTAQHLCDMLGRDKKLPPKLLLVTEEMSLCVGDRALADRLIRLATALYMCSPYEFSEGTRTHGAVRFTNHCLSWLAGTMQEWLRDAIPRSAVEGGFFARANIVIAEGPIPRVVRPAINVGELPWLVDFVRQAAQLAGPMTMTPDADALYWDWYERRPDPTAPILEPVWARVPIHVLKLATLLAIAESSSMQIDASHVDAARQLAESSLRHLPALMEYVAMSPDVEGLKRVRDAIRNAGAIYHGPLVRAMMQFGLTATKIREHLETLREGRLVRRELDGAAFVYTWRGGHIPEEEQ